MFRYIFDNLNKIETQFSYRQKKVWLRQFKFYQSCMPLDMEAYVLIHKISLIYSKVKMEHKLQSRYAPFIPKLLQLKELYGTGLLVLKVVILTLKFKNVQIGLPTKLRIR